MRVEMNFDGTRLHLRLVVEDDTERAMATLIGAYTQASVSLDHATRSIYENYRDPEVRGVSICLSKPPVLVEGTPCNGCMDWNVCRKNGICAIGIGAP